MASFIIALLVCGLDIILGFIIALGMARTAGAPEFAVAMLSGRTALICLNVMSIPLCLVGAGLGFLGLVAHRDRNQLFSWIGLVGNGFVIVGVIGLYVIAAILDAAKQNLDMARQSRDVLPALGIVILLILMIAFGLFFLARRLISRSAHLKSPRKNPFD